MKLARSFLLPLSLPLQLSLAVTALFIAGVLCLNATIGAIQEWKAERSAQALQKLLKVRATVERDDEIMEIDAEEVVPGDLVWLVPPKILAL